MRETWAVVLTAVGTLSLLGGCGGDGSAAPDTGPMPSDAGGDPDTATPFPDAGAPDTGPVGTLPPGAACGCDDECEGDATHPGVCVFGVCMTRASATCAEGGSTAECPAGSRCWGLTGRSDSLCWPDCDSFTCDGTCDSDGSCVFSDSTSCDPACGAICGPAPCGADNPDGACETEGEVCVEGTCTVACAPGAPTGYCPPTTTCTDGACVSAAGCPSYLCTGAGCDELVLMPGSSEATSADALRLGYYRSSPDRYSYIRRDLGMLLAYAACETAAKFPGTTPLAIGDLSQADGMTPGLDSGSARHPTTTHRGSDLDLAYYQTDGANNYQIICGDGSDRNGNGVAATYNDGYYCTTDENVVDMPRQAYFFAKMSANGLGRVFGVDRTLVAPLRAALQSLRDAGDITPAEHSGAGIFGYDDPGVFPGDEAYRGWAFHHHHNHLSYE